VSSRTPTSQGPKRRRDGLATMSLGPPSNNERQQPRRRRRKGASRRELSTPTTCHPVFVLVTGVTAKAAATALQSPPSASPTSRGGVTEDTRASNIESDARRVQERPVYHQHPTTKRHRGERTRGLHRVKVVKMSRYGFGFGLTCSRARVPVHYTTAPRQPRPAGFAGRP